MIPILLAQLFSKALAPRPLQRAGAGGNGRRKRINLALQGGGAHGAFTWGVLDRLLEESAAKQQEVADQLGGQVRRGVELLIATLDAADSERHGALLADLDEGEVYRGAVTVMMRLVSRAPRDRVVVAESGVWSRAQGAAAELAGADAILVGSALMKAPDPAAKARMIFAYSEGLLTQARILNDVEVLREMGEGIMGILGVKRDQRKAA